MKHFSAPEHFLQEKHKLVCQCVSLSSCQWVSHLTLSLAVVTGILSERCHRHQGVTRHVTRVTLAPSLM